MSDISVQKNKDAFAQLNSPFEGLLRDFGFPALAFESTQRAPAADIIETTEAFIVKLDVPGVEQKDIDIKLEGDTLVVRAEHTQEKKDEKYHLYERRYGSFARAFTLPSSVDSTKTEASYKNGVLTVTLPKREDAKPRSISVKLS